MTCLRPFARIIILVVGLYAVPAMAADDRAVDTITHQLRCLTCPNETIADSTTPMAMDVKDYIRAHLDQGEDADTIIHSLTQRYGAALRYKPPLAPHTYILWAMPLVCLIMGIIILLRTFYRKRKTLP